MPDGDEHPVSFGRWEEAHHALADRVHACEVDIDRIKGDIIQAQQSRVNRQWEIALALLTAFLLPLLVATIILAVQGTLGHS